MTDREKQDLSDIFAALGMNSDQITVGQVVGTQVIMYPGAHVHVDNKERASETVPEAEEVESEEMDVPETAEDGYNADTCGLRKCFYTRFAWHYIWEHHNNYKSTSHWAAVYCALRAQELIEDNTAAYCRWVEEKWGANPDNSNLRDVISQGVDLSAWNVTDKRRRAACQSGLDLLEAIIKYREQHLQERIRQ